MMHLAIVPIALPLIVGAIMIMLDDQHSRLRPVLGVGSALVLLAVAVTLAVQAHEGGTGTGLVTVYRMGDWPAIFGIVLVVDRLSAMLLVLTAVLGLAALLYSLTRWQRMGAHFHALFQFQLMGLNGAFLTGDLFNLFVFFEVLLAASYGLALHGSGIARVKAGLHYIAINLAASVLFLIGVSMIYGVAGTLNMADLAARIPQIPAADRPLLEAGAAILGMAFLVKAGMWPLGFWLPPTYSVVSPPAAAIFSMMSKVGVYALLRVSLLMFGDGAGDSAGFGETWLLVGGIMTIAFGAVSVLATQDLSRLAGASVLISSGTLLAAIGAGQLSVTGGALYYLASSALAIGALFLLIELLERGREVGADVLAVTLEAFGDGEDEDEEEDEVGVAIPSTMAVLGLCFLCCALLLAGLPPLSGFIAKFSMLTGILNPNGLGEGPATVSPGGWALLTALVLSGLATVIAMTRAGIRSIWATTRAVPRVRVIEIAPVLLLLGLCIGMTASAGSVMRYMQAAAAALHAPQAYVQNVLGETP
ncbi:monovalent cation/H+ antiporter subunit D (plasmid) [Roseomonas marmotae]|uniref:Monovalent cation/H+ antiporter subunit D n=2 Tax=Roseomonas marmotae TaxID=2768161 RepID=A0ABS3KAV6_9PROT|nr:monovalent cation/H+ antiporter subunit D [Roseomonas marmotae]MBO1074588.1 monovalent cation/H+ antiporter subunit D [Roseomonas marmotae]QTI81749.1 monovalent cation/H+ antiporter subunit D [Roseomonas marmotae]